MSTLSRTQPILAVGATAAIAVPVAAHAAGAPLAIVALLVFVLGVALGAGLSALKDASARSRRLTREHAALRSLATVVAAHESTEHVFTRAAEEAARLLDAESAVVVRREGDQARMLGMHGIPAELVSRDPYPLVDAAELHMAFTTNAPVRVDGYPPDATSPVAQRGHHSLVAVPVHVDGEVWGFIAASAEHAGELPADAADRLLDLGDLIALAIVNDEARERLAGLASSDPLTGLSNHRVFHERLGEETARARRYGHALAAVVLDIDEFKRINDTAGHQQGDVVLKVVGERLAEVARTSDVLARIGGDEFAMLLPETDRFEAFAVIQRARAAIAASAPAGMELTVSAGVCDLATAGGDAHTLLRLADAALYRSKEQGRDAASIYDPKLPVKRGR